MSEETVIEVEAIVLTDEEKRLIVEVFSKLPIQGTIQTLPSQLEKIISIIKKLS